MCAFVYNGNCDIWWDSPSACSFPPSRRSDSLAVQAPIQISERKATTPKAQVWFNFTTRRGFFVCGLAALPARADAVTSSQEIQADFRALQLNRSNSSHLHYFSCCGDVIPSHRFHYFGWIKQAEFMRQSAVIVWGYFSSQTRYLNVCCLRDSKALQEANQSFDHSFAALCCGTCRQLRAASGCNNGSFSPPVGLLVPSITFQAEVTGPTCYPTSKLQVRRGRVSLERCGEREREEEGVVVQSIIGICMLEMTKWSEGQSLSRGTQELIFHLVWCTLKSLFEVTVAV